ncbi:ribonuclease H-like domain-containing protein [Tanacetum coccineum]
MAGSEDDNPPPSQTQTQQTPHTVSTIKLPILKKGEYDIWAMKMEHYLAHTDYPIWEVIQRGNGPVSVSTDTNGLIKVLPPKTAEETLARERERKARTTLLMALPEDHLAKFHKMTDAKEMWEAIKSRFGGNDESKKMQKYILKQQFEGFSVSNSEGLHKGYDRFQSLLSQLEIHGAGVSTEDANQKFLRSLPSAWSQVSLIMRTKPGVDSLSFDDLYNNLRVFESDVKGSTASSSSTQNVAFVSENTSSTNDVSTAYVFSTSGHNSQYEHTSSYSLLANQSSCPQLDDEDLEKLDEFDLEEMDLKWQEPVGFDKTKVEYYNCHKIGHFARECRSKGNQDGRRRDAWNTGNKKKDNGRRFGSDTEREQLGDASIEMQAYTQALKKVEAQLKLLAEAEKEKEDLKAKVEKWHNSSKNLNILLNSQMSARDKAGLGTSETENSPMNDRYAEGMHAVPVGIYRFDETKEQKNETRRTNSALWDSKRLKVKQLMLIIIEEYESDSEDEHVSLPTKEHEIPSFAVKHTGNTINAARKVKTVKPIVTNARPKASFHNSVSSFRKSFYRTTTLRTNFSKQKVNTVEVNAISAVKGKRETAVKALQNKGIVDSGCSRHMTRNKAYLAEYQDFNGGPVSFGGSKGYITGKGKIKTGKLDFEDVCFVKELQHFNLFSMSKICDKKNKVLFTDSECLLLSLEFKLPNENQFLLRIPRQNNMYSFNLENIIPFGGKQHKASCKAKTVSSISQPLQLLHMDLFGPTSVRSLNHKTYCLVITDDFSRCDNGTEFKNRDFIEFCGSKGIKREYSNVRTPQQNGVAERKNRTLIEAARTMLANSFLANTFWAEAVSTACYVLNRVLVTKPQNKTPYELITGDSKIEAESAQDHFDQPIWSSYTSTVKSSKANNAGEEPTKHPDLKPVDKEDQVFLDELERLKRQEQDANDAAEALRKDTASPYGGLSFTDLTNTDQDDSEIPTLEEIYDNPTAGIFTNASYDDEGAVADFTNLETIVNVSPIPTSRINSIHPSTLILGDPKSAVQTRSKVTKSSGAHAFVSYIQKQRRNNHKDFQHCLFACFLSQNEPKKISEALEDESWVDAMQEELLQFKIQKVWILVDLPYGKKAIGTKWVYRNKKDERGVVVRNKARLVAQGHRQEEGIDYDEVFAPVAKHMGLRIQSFKQEFIHDLKSIVNIIVHNISLWNKILGLLELKWVKMGFSGSYA